jgi:transposase InsO family protein
MAGDGVAVEARLAAAVGAVARGESLNVAAVCRDLGVSRKTFYKYLARFRVEGVEGFFPRSRRPRHSPRAVGDGVEELVVRARKELIEDGWDGGAISIRWRLLDRGEQKVPSRATIHRILVRCGLVIPAPAKRPRRTYRRFRAPWPNAMWQMDGFDYRLAEGTTVTVLQLVDDYSRLDLCCLAARSENGADVWVAFQQAVSRYGLPRALLTDNGTAFNGHRRGFTVDLERRVAALGVKPISCRPDHPQTCGKDERAHATLEQWLKRRRPADDLAGLQELLDRYREQYNHRRRHQALDLLTPQQCWDLAKVDSAGQPLAPPPLVSTHPVSARGEVRVENHEVGIGRRYAGRQATCFQTGDVVTVFVGADCVRTLTLDRTRRYQPQNPRS